MTEPDDNLRKAYAAFDADDFVRAKDLFERLEQLDNQVHLYLGWMYAEGLGCSPDLKQAEYHYQCLSDAGDADGKYYLASLYQKKGDLVRAVGLYEDAAEAGQVSAAYWAYDLRATGPASLLNADKADRYLRKAAALGHIFAQRDLARREMRSGGVLNRVRGSLRYLALKVKGLFLIMKNSQDMRVR